MHGVMMQMSVHVSG